MIIPKIRRNEPVSFDALDDKRCIFSERETFGVEKAGSLRLYRLLHVLEDFRILLPRDRVGRNLRSRRDCSRGFALSRPPPLSWVSALVLGTEAAGGRCFLSGAPGVPATPTPADCPAPPLLAGSPAPAVSAGCVTGSGLGSSVPGTGLLKGRGTGARALATSFSSPQRIGTDVFWLPVPSSLRFGNSFLKVSGRRHLHPG